MAGNIKIGTCSWTDPTLTETDLFYPETTMSAEERLGFYAEHFSIVEVDSTYYAPPSERVAGLWVERTPDDFTFDIKAFQPPHPAPDPSQVVVEGFHGEAARRDEGQEQRLHARPAPGPPGRSCPGAPRRFEAASFGGEAGGRRFQFPPYVYPTRGSFGYMKWVAAELEDFQLAVEFRNGRWVDDEHMTDTLDFLERHSFAYVCVDEPQGFKSSVPPVVAVTAPVAEVRFHGRNAENWGKKGITAAERFRYHYPKEDRLDQTAEDKITGYNRPEHLRAFPETHQTFNTIEKPLRASAESAKRYIDDHHPRERLHHYGFQRNSLSMLAWQIHQNA